MTRAWIESPAMRQKMASPIPTFLYIGTAKAGSSWIFEALREHPDVFVPKAKDLKYFDVHYETRSFSQYLKYFQNTDDHRVVGELSHDYFTSPLYADRIRKHLPGVKLICCLREPGALAVSSYKYIRMLRKEADASFPDFVGGYLREKGYIRYLENLQFFYKRFPHENILVVFFDDLQSNPQQFVAEIYGFIGVSVDFQPSVLHRQVNAAATPRFSAGTTQLSYSTVQLMRRLGLENLVGKLKSSQRVRKLLFKTEDKRESKVDEDALRQLRSEAMKDYKAIEQLIGKALPAGWRSAEETERQ